MYLQDPAHGLDYTPLYNMVSSLRGLSEDSTQYACGSLGDKQEWWH